MPGLGQDGYRMSLEHLVMPENNVQKMIEVCYRDIGATMKGLPLAKSEAV